MKINNEIVKNHGLKLEEYEKIKKLLREDGYTIKGSKKVLTIKNYSVDSTSDDNINAEKIMNLKNKIKDLKKYING